MDRASKSNLQTLPSELIDRIIFHCQEKDYISSKELRQLGSVCRSFRYAVLPYLGRHIAFMLRYKTWSNFSKFTEFVHSYPSYGRYVRHLTVETPREVTSAPCRALLPTLFSSLDGLELSNAYLVSGIKDIPSDCPPFPNLRYMNFTAPPNYSNTTTNIELSVDAIQPIWRSPKLAFVRFINVNFLPGALSHKGELPPVESLSLTACKIADRTLQQLTQVRAISKFSLGRVTIEPFATPIAGIHEIELNASREERRRPPVDLFPDLKRLPLSDEKLFQVHHGSQKIPSSLQELQVLVDVVKTERERFLKLLHATLRSRFTSLKILKLDLEASLPLDEDAGGRSDDEEAEDSDAEADSDADNGSGGAGDDGDSDGSNEVGPSQCNQGDWETIPPKYGYNNRYKLELSDEGTDNADETLESANSDHFYFEGHTALMELCRERGIALACRWIVRGE